jgi:PAS domain S-box-containing protein
LLPVAKAEIFLGLSSPILVLDDKNRVLDFNPAAESLLNKQASKHIGKDIAQMLVDQPEIANLLQSDRKSEIYLTKDDKERYYEVCNSSLNNRRGMRIGRVIVFYDITERHRADQAMRERERLKGVLEMAGAVSHDLSQPVMAILGYVELILGEVPQNDKLNANAAKLDKQAKRLSDMTTKLMNITRYETKSLQGNQIIDIDKASSIRNIDPA